MSSPSDQNTSSLGSEQICGSKRPCPSNVTLGSFLQGGLTLPGSQGSISHEDLARQLQTKNKKVDGSALNVLVKCLLTRHPEKATEELKKVFTKLRLEGALNTLELELEKLRETQTGGAAAAAESDTSTTTPARSPSLRERQIAAFNKTKPSLLNYLEPSDILPYFSAHQKLTDTDIEEIRGKTNRNARVDEFSKRIMRRDGWWDCLIAALKANIQGFLATELHEALEKQ